MNEPIAYIRERIQDISIHENTSLRDALKQMDKGAMGVALIIEPETAQFKGLVTDGDIRRALIKGLDLDMPVSRVKRPKTTTALITDPPEKISELFGDAIRIVPLLDSSRRVADLALFENRVRLPVSEPNLSGNEAKYLRECVLTGWVSSAGKFVTQFEQMFARFCGTEYAVSSSSGTTALHLALLAAGIGPGDEVILPSFTFISTANAVTYTGATPVFVDSEKQTWNIDPNKIIEAISPRTKAIIPVHLYGHPADMDPILSIGKTYQLKIIEDAAEAHGATYKRQKTGSMGDAGIFSFYGNKTITTGEGGMVVTNDKTLAENVRLFRDHGMHPSKRYRHTVLGYNYRLTNIQAALGVAQMERIDAIIYKKRKNARCYKKLLEDIPGLTLPPEEQWAKNIFWLFSILVDEKEFGISSEKLAEKLAEKSIETRPLFPPVHLQPIYDSGQHLPVCEGLSETGLSLPSSVNINEREIKKITDVIHGIQKNPRS